MIVRTYGRRNRGLTRTFSDSLDDDVEDQFSDSLSQENNPPPPPASTDQHNPFSAFSSQDSSAFDFDSYSLPSFSSLGSEFFFEDSSQKGLVGRKKKSNKKARLGGKRELVVQATSTLMEAQEFGEMMEHVDEVNFALDGLRKVQPVRIRRASLLSLLSIAGTAPQRRLLRTQGLAKTIIDAILALSFDDPTGNLAIATLFYVLTCDGQDDRLLESPMCIRFLIKMLKPVDSMDAENKEPKLGHRLLQVCKDVATTMERLDSSSSTIISKVEEILVSCKEIKPNCGDGSGMRRPELCPKWISLLTMEKACESTISLEETSGAVRKSGGNFKEKLRELGGLDAIFEVARNCHSDMEGWVESSSLSIKSGKFKMDIKALALLLKCLKIMENAAFLSNNNQNHLLRMKGNLIHRRNPISFTELVVNIIRILSGLYLRKDSSGGFDDRKSVSLLHGTNYSFEFDLMEEKSNDALSNTNSSKNWWSQEKTSSEKSFKTSKESSHLFSNLQVENSTSGSENTSGSMGHTTLKLRLGSSFTSNSSSGSLGNSNAGKSRKNFGLLNKSPEVINLDDSLEEDCQDPFAFDDGDFELSKWEVLSGKQKVSQTRKRSLKYREVENRCHQSRSMSQEESSLPPESSSCSKITDNEEGISLLADCLLASIKVLMNLTNDNPIGCRQIASCGGLETMCSLIACHFPMFSQTSSPLSKLVELDRSNNDNDKHLSDQELDFLVAILGLLVNLIEKDGHNRSQLAATSIPFPSSQGKEGGSHRDVIPLLCSIFLANKGAGEEAEEGPSVPWNDEEAVLEGEKEAEKMILEAYSALLLAFLSTESKRIRNKIAECLPDHSLIVLVPVLERFAAFHLTLNMISPETHKAVNEVIESCRIP